MLPGMCGPPLYFPDRVSVDAVRARGDVQKRTTEEAAARRRVNQRRHRLLLARAAAARPSRRRRVPRPGATPRAPRRADAWAAAPRPWDAFTDDHIGLMDHLGIDKFMVLGYCIGGRFILNPSTTAPTRRRARAVAPRARRAPT